MLDLLFIGLTIVVFAVLWLWSRGSSALSVENWIGLIGGVLLTDLPVRGPRAAGEVLMSSTAAGWLQFALLFAALAACYVPLGNYIARIFTTDKDWRIERAFYKLIGIDHKADQKWCTYVRSILAFSFVSVLFLYGMQRLQHYLSGSWGLPAVTPDTAWNTAVSFVTNTNWQNYGGENTMSYIAQMSGLVVQQFMSAAVGLVVAIAMIRGFTRSHTDKLGNFWVDVTRGVVRLLIPLRSSAG